MPITVGQKAPNFNLPDTDKNMVSLEALKGKNVVLLFFPAAFSGGCTKEMCHMRDSLASFNSLNAQVFGISVDMHFALVEFKKANNINFPLLSDFNKAAIKAYDIVIESFSAGYQGVSKRASFVIDKNGNVVFAEVLPAPGDFPDFDGIRKALESVK